MREEHWMREDHLSLDATFSEAEAQRAILERMKRTAHWAEHERFHRENGGEAQLVLRTENAARDEPVLRAEQRVEAGEPQTRARPILTGWCQCQSPSVRLVLGEDGDVENRPPEPLDTNSYGVVASDAPVYGGASAGAVQYKPGGTDPSNLYK